MRKQIRFVRELKNSNFLCPALAQVRRLSTYNLPRRSLTWMLSSLICSGGGSSSSSGSSSSGSGIHSSGWSYHDQMTRWKRGIEKIDINHHFLTKLFLRFP